MESTTPDVAGETDTADYDEANDDVAGTYYCALDPAPSPELPPEVAANVERAAAIIDARDKWANHTVLHYAFFASGPWAVPAEQAAVVRDGFARWKALGIGLEFDEVEELDDAEIRIGFQLGGGSASAVGRRVLDIPLNQRTMTFGWNLTVRGPNGLPTAIHEIGHSLGLPHEHQNPMAGIVWDEEAVYRSLGGPPNSWDREKTFHNVLRKLDPNEVKGSNWDPDSIMEYAFGPGLVRQPEQYREGIFPPGTLSELDKAWVKKWYPDDTAAPQVLEPFQSLSFDLVRGQQVDFVLRPTTTRRYTIGTFGASDTVLVLFEEVGGSPRFLAGADDSGTDRNASIATRLRAGRTYILRMRLYYPGQSGRAAVMYW
jgi:hypothetical protein